MVAGLGSLDPITVHISLRLLSQLWVCMAFKECHDLCSRNLLLKGLFEAFTCEHANEEVWQDVVYAHEQFEDVLVQNTTSVGVNFEVGFNDDELLRRDI